LKTLKILRTLQLMFYALLPKRSAAPPGSAHGEVWRCQPGELRGGMDRFLDENGELRVVFLDCLAAAAPFVLFRLKRQGFSRCIVWVSEQGLHVEGRR
jgi:hypothetical protein